MADFDGEDPSEILGAGDTQLMKIITQKSDAGNSGIIASFVLSNGKSIKSLFLYLTKYTDINFNFFKQGLQIDGISYNELNTIDSTTYMTLKGNKLTEYNFIPSNIFGDSTLDAVAISVNSKEFFSFLKKCRAKTSIRLELNRNNPKLILYVINDGITKVFFIDYKQTNITTCPISGSIVDPNTPDNYKTLVEVFSNEMAGQHTKYGGIFYDFNIAVYNEGIYVWSDANGVGGTPYGKVDGTYLHFQLKNSCAKHWLTLFRITPSSTLSITALDSNVLKLSMPIGSYGDMYEFQFPKITNAMIAWASQRNTIPNQFPVQIENNH